MVLTQQGNYGKDTSLISGKLEASLRQVLAIGGDDDRNLKLSLFRSLEVFIHLYTSDGNETKTNEFHSKLSPADSELLRADKLPPAHPHSSRQTMHH